MTVRDIVNMNDHDKQTIYEAYSLEAAVRKKMNEDLNKERRLSAQLRFESMAWRDAWLEETIRNEHKDLVVGDLEDAIDYYFSHPQRALFTTNNNGYYAVTNEGDHIFVMFAGANYKKWRAEVRDMPALIKDIASIGLPVRWTSKRDFLKNHSIEIEPGLWELKL